MSKKYWKNEIFTIPNLLSFFRLILIPVYVALYHNARDNEDYLLAAVILAVSCLTDMIDGKIARHFHMISNFGKILDPLADKLTQFSLILCLACRYPFLWYLCALFVVKESFQLIAGGIRLRKGSILKGALLSGKISTTVLFLSLIILVMLPGLSKLTVEIIAIIDVVFLSLAFADYIFVYLKNDSQFQSIKKDPK